MRLTLSQLSELELSNHVFTCARRADLNWCNHARIQLDRRRNHCRFRVFHADESDAYIRLVESSGFSDAPIDTEFGPQLRQDVRNNSRVMIDDPDRAEQLWQRSINYIPRFVGNWSAIGVNERFRFYRYDIGQQFDWHHDGAFERPNGQRSRLTFMIYLHDNFDGGQTSFEDCKTVPETGLALFFVHQIRHKGEPVLKGRKYVLRTDVIYRLSDA